MIKTYILEHYNEYGLHHDNGKPISKADMLELLNILESQGETLESLHDVAFNGYSEFCGIYSNYTDDNKTYNALLSHFRFFSESEFIEYMLEQIEEYREDGSTDVAEYFKLFDDSIYKTSDGYVKRYDY